MQINWVKVGAGITAGTILLVILSAAGIVKAIITLVGAL